MTPSKSEAAEHRPSRLTATVHVRTFAALVALTIVSFTVSYLHLGAFEMPVAMLIAVLKVSLVGLFFMGLVEESASSLLAALAAVLFVGFLLSFAVADVLTRR